MGILHGYTAMIDEKVRRLWNTHIEEAFKIQVGRAGGGEGGGI